ncbi:MAG TPA: nicotinate-nucleotide adenylyltransferase [Alphaproteobacteria bacterium]|nr:nicotinate-nucleotide adenylyltransferase [Alphaproteobacteria bacterium]
MRVGLLGGSFNPAHEGHRHISLEALRLLGLDQVWWLVSPQNPLKPSAGMAPLDRRLRRARDIANHPAIIATDLERQIGTRYTAETLAALTSRFPRTRFVWLMGADNLMQLPRWRRWTLIFETVPVAIFDRRPYSLRALSGQAARRYARQRVKGHQAALLADAEPPAWVYFHTRLHPASATALRACRTVDPA